MPGIVCIAPESIDGHPAPGLQEGEVQIFLAFAKEEDEWLVMSIPATSLEEVSGS